MFSALWLYRMRKNSKTLKRAAIHTVSLQHSSCGRFTGQGEEGFRLTSRIQTHVTQEEKSDRARQRGRRWPATSSDSRNVNHPNNLGNSGEEVFNSSRRQRRNRTRRGGEDGVAWRSPQTARPPAAAATSASRPPAPAPPAHRRRTAPSACCEAA